MFSTLGGLLFVMLPTLWERAFRHTALASQWLFLLALYAFLEYRQNLHSGTAKFPWAMPVLAFLAVGIHPYFLPLVMMCALLAAARRCSLRQVWQRLWWAAFCAGPSAPAPGHLAPAMAITP